MPDKIANQIYEYASLGRIRFKKHALIRIVERKIRVSEVEEVIQNCKIIAEYSEDSPLKSYLILGFTQKGRPLHIVIALDKKEKYIWVITVYEPNKNKWDNTFTKRL